MIEVAAFAVIFESGTAAGGGTRFRLFLYQVYSRMVIAKVWDEFSWEGTQKCGHVTEI